MKITHKRAEEPHLLIEIDDHEGHLLFMALMNYKKKEEATDLALQIDEKLSAIENCIVEEEPF